MESSDSDSESVKKSDSPYNDANLDQMGTDVSLAPCGSCEACNVTEDCGTTCENCVNNYIQTAIENSSNPNLLPCVKRMCQAKKRIGVKMEKVLASEINRLRNLSENFSNLLVDENSSDFLIICGDDKFPVHRNVLKARSSFFNGLLRNENNYAENNTGQLVINNMDSGTVKIVIEYIYTGKIKDLESKAVQLLKAADMYDFPLLKKCCEDELISSMNLENVVDLFVLAADHNASDLKVVAKKMILKNKADIVKQEGYQAKMGTLVFELFEAM